MRVRHRNNIINKCQTHPLLRNNCPTRAASRTDDLAPLPHGSTWPLAHFVCSIPSGFAQYLSFHAGAHLEVIQTWFNSEIGSEAGVIDLDSKFRSEV
jgi:hypothetical protein